MMPVWARVRAAMSPWAKEGGRGWGAGRQRQGASREEQASNTSKVGAMAGGWDLADGGLSLGDFDGATRMGRLGLDHLKSLKDVASPNLVSLVYVFDLG